jgi:hypothetical protein
MQDLATSANHLLHSPNRYVESQGENSLEFAPLLEKRTFVNIGDLFESGVQGCYAK